MLFARALQMFMPGRPQIWYLDLLCGKNDHEAVKRAGEGGHKEINRTNYSLEKAMEALRKETVQRQIDLIRFRNQNPVFVPEAEVEVELSSDEKVLIIRWTYEEHHAELHADFEDYRFQIGELR